MTSLKRCALVLFMLLVSTATAMAFACSEGECDDGGEGSESCSHTYTSYYVLGFWAVEETVSTSCDEGYYACCNNGSAECIEEGLSQLEICMPGSN